MVCFSLILKDFGDLEGLFLFRSRVCSQEVLLLVFAPGLGLEYVCLLAGETPVDLDFPSRSSPRISNAAGCCRVGSGWILRERLCAFCFPAFPLMAKEGFFAVRFGTRFEGLPLHILSPVCQLDPRAIRRNKFRRVGPAPFSGEAGPWRLGFDSNRIRRRVLRGPFQTFFSLRWRA